MANPATVGQRFTALISHLGISKNAFAASLDKTATVIQHLVDERNKPGFDLLCKVFEVYPSVSKEWLLQGIGPMLTEEISSQAQPNSLPSTPVRQNEKVAHATAPVATSVVASAAAAVPGAIAEVVPTTAPEPVAPPTPAPSTPEPISSPTEALPEAPATTSPLPVASPALNASAAAPVADTSWQTALYTQQMAHQLALAELRNQHLQDQQRLMQQMMDLMQRQLAR
ncbi:hypothetical protein [Hymenobacter sublimis]|uniref:XRE family transcriptional regulator n=1 Tax=Hymenobacter sublimis TaxID=2933777 RepID=A0ABY4JGH7_9BACT|nr:hypothetical protein [Hymenobacter sublimis]UPL51079.1 hypothetical protein MWH26_09255 [Hymenobacter sublimis]